VKKAISAFVSIWVLGAACTAFAAEKPSILAGVVEHTGSAEVVRLVVSPAVQSIEEKIVCAEGMIRVRLDGITNRGQEIQELRVPSGGPIRRVRIVERNPSNSVVQLYPRHNPQGTCSRTTVAAFGKEIVISTTFTASEAARLNPRPLDKAAAPSAKRGADRAAGNEDAAPAIAPAGASNPSNGTAPEKEEEGLVFKKRDNAADNATSPAMGTSALDTPKLAFGFGFAALAAGLALYLKKKKKFSAPDLDSIDILSTRRLGARQQLVLVSVQGVRFLLAVAEKSVTSLGVVSEDDGGMRRLPAPTPETPQMSVESTLETLIGEASRRAVRNEVPPSKAAAPVTFDSELRRALDHTALGADKPAPQARFDSASNAAGLVALARMRANLKKSTGRSQVFEA